MISKRPSSHFTLSNPSSRSSSRYAPSAGGWDADDEDAMSTSEDQILPLSTTSSTSSTTRPLSVAIPQASGPYCPRRPNLKEILANSSPPPWTLAAFMAYLSSNLCLENLEFTMDAGRYKKHYAKMLAKAGESGKPSQKDSEYVRLLWVRLIDAYIAPNGSREVNLPSNVRDPILNAETSPMPPAPETLDLAVTKTFELMEESVLVPFLNSAYPQDTGIDPVGTNETSHRPGSVSAQTYEEHGSLFSKRKKARDSPPPHMSVEPQAHSYPSAAGMNRISAPLTLSSSLNKSRPSTKSHPSGSLSTTMSNTSDANLSMLNWSGPGMTDDSGSTGSPTNDGPMTPPMSPPVNDLGGHAFGQKHGRDSGMWKKLGRLSGMKVGKKKNHSGEHSE